VHLRAHTVPLLAAAGRALAKPGLGLVRARCARAPPLCAPPRRPPAASPAPICLLRFSSPMCSTTPEARRKRQLLTEQQHEAAQQIASPQGAARGSRGLQGRCGASARHGQWLWLCGIRTAPTSSKYECRRWLH